MDRIKLLLQFIEEEPDNPFNLYAIALEYQNTDQEAARDYFEKLLENHADYLPTYFHAAALFAEFGKLEKAQQIYESGIDLAKQQNDQHTLRELQNAYQNFLFEYDID
ncbi:tetratricopeptide repeat protein [Echinicola jeungdonensis]|uniref:Tetratricopeptide repeat protein n=1 Tax=Echinicola jeungdonensis TaxID=709343 RepID=A0ABV5J112_9BACT|nr:tetratricopeptide repeat protein [Echinicola jeungdonensis]MDN3671183.1 tetratricopeptide repeat protein [Echinicola jeungdonensis]